VGHTTPSDVTMGCGNSTDPKKDPPASDAPQAADVAVAAAAADDKAAAEDNAAAPESSDPTSSGIHNSFGRDMEVVGEQVTPGGAGEEYKDWLQVEQLSWESGLDCTALFGEEGLNINFDDSEGTGIPASPENDAVIETKTQGHLARCGPLVLDPEQPASSELEWVIPVEQMAPEVQSAVKFCVKVRSEVLPEVSRIVLELWKGPPNIAQVFAEQFDLLLGKMPAGFVISDPVQEDNPIIYNNDMFTGITQFNVAESIGRNCRFLQGPMTDAKTVTQLSNDLHANRGGIYKLINYRKDGHLFENMLFLTPILMGGHCVAHLGVQMQVLPAESMLKWDSVYFNTYAGYGPDYQ